MKEGILAQDYLYSPRSQFEHLDFRFGGALAVSCPKKAEVYFMSIEHFFEEKRTK
jgi:hypothetical protein